MKKFFVIILCLFLLTACNKEETKEKIIYNNYIKTLNNNFKTTNNIPFDIEIYLDKISNTEVMYRAIIDNPKTSIKNIEVLIIHDKYTKDIYPSSGIFDEKYSLIPNTIEKSNNKLFHYLVSRRSEINLSTDNNTVIGIHVKNRVFINSK